MRADKAAQVGVAAHPPYRKTSIISPYRARRSTYSTNAEEPSRRHGLTTPRRAPRRHASRLSPCQAARHGRQAGGASGSGLGAVGGAVERVDGADPDPAQGVGLPARADVADPVQVGQLGVAAEDEVAQR